MDINSPRSPQFFLQPAIRSYYFLVGTILLGVNVAGGVLMFVRHLNRLPFGAAGCLIAGIVLLVSSWRLALRRHERISLLLTGKQEPLTEKSLTVALSVSADVIETGLLVTNIIALLLLAAIGQVFMGC